MRVSGAGWVHAAFPLWIVSGADKESKKGVQLIGETFDGVGMVKAVAAQRIRAAATRVLLVGAGGVGVLAIANRTRAKADDLADTVRCADPACTVEAGTAFDPAAFNIVINATSLA